MKALLSSLVLILLLTLPAGASQLPMYDFLGSRRVVATIGFFPGSAELNQKARSALDRLAGTLSRIDPERRVVRLEGFCCDREIDDPPMELSFERALAVEEYIRSAHKLPQQRYLVGFGLDNKRAGVSLPIGRVEIALYDNILNIDGNRVEKGY